MHLFICYFAFKANGMPAYGCVHVRVQYIVVVRQSLCSRTTIHTIKSSSEGQYSSILQTYALQTTPRIHHNVLTTKQKNYTSSKIPTLESIFQAN